jgi:hypothetical protein
VAGGQQAGEECAESEESGGCEQTACSKGALHPVREEGAQKAVKRETDNHARGRALLLQNWRENKVRHRSTTFLLKGCPIPTGRCQHYTLRYAHRCFTARNLTVSIAVPHFSRRDVVCVYDRPWTRITFADKDHARLQLQRSIEPRHSVRGASSYFDLNDLRHAFPCRQNAAPAKHMPRLICSRLGSCSRKLEAADRLAQLLWQYCAGWLMSWAIGHKFPSMRIFSDLEPQASAPRVS